MASYTIKLATLLVATLILLLLVSTIGFMIFHWSSVRTSFGPSRDATYLFPRYRMGGSGIMLPAIFTPYARVVVHFPSRLALGQVGYVSITHNANGLTEMDEQSALVQNNLGTPQGSIKVEISADGFEIPEKKGELLLDTEATTQRQWQLKPILLSARAVSLNLSTTVVDKHNQKHFSQVPVNLSIDTVLSLPAALKLWSLDAIQWLISGCVALLSTAIVSVIGGWLRANKEQVMKNYVTINMGSGATFTGPFAVGQTISQTYSALAGVNENNLRKQLESMVIQVSKLVEQLPSEDEKTEISEQLSTFVEQAKKDKPSKKLLQLTADGMLEAAKTITALTGPVTTAVRSVLDLLFPTV